MSELERASGGEPPPRLLHAAAAAVIAVAVVGFLTGTRGRPTGHELPVAYDGPRTTAADVPRYAGMSSESRGPNADVYQGGFERLVDRLPAVTAEVEGAALTDPAARAAALAARAARRAYDGAPPTIPHPIDQRNYPACLSCHERGAVIAGRIAPAMSHEPHDSCTQCHAPEQNPVDLGGPPPVNAFAGLVSPGTGTRAYDGAPPTIPHTTAMRDRCGSCHGVSGASPLRSTHPWRRSCRQCHVPDAAADGRAPFPVPGGSP